MGRKYVKIFSSNIEHNKKVNIKKNSKKERGYATWG